MKHEKAETSAVNLKARVEAYERVLVVEALRRTKGNQSRAAELLGTSQRIVNYKIRKYRLDLCLFR
ncbi:MAG TPA: helix-turn-helix domain-containing protein [Syntrophales bacterium]|nr:helix-turn-helix domain-containing protein [Syntrophales bacterium]HNS54049.1 helix-turn-helix domain-containing protein [Syntrophales bacterium]